MKKLIALAALLLALGVNLYAQGGQAQYIEECDWYGSREPIECFQDWYLFAYWPLECRAVCEGQEICLGLFPTPEQETTYPLDEKICCEFAVFGQLGWTFDAAGSVVYDVGGALVTFEWGHASDILGPYANLFTGTGSPGLLGNFTLDDDLGGGLGAHYFQICATSVTLAAGFNGLLNVKTTMSFVYSPI